MPRSVWTGTISFGLVSIPVKLFNATSPRDVRFHQVDRETGARVRYRRVVGTLPGEESEELEEQGRTEDFETSPSQAAPSGFDPGPEVRPEPRTEGAGEIEVPYERIVKGYEIEPDRWVLLERDEIEALQAAPSRAIEIENFVDLGEVDPVHFEKSYFLAPIREVGAERSYALLLRALERANVAGIGRFVLRRKEHLAAIRPRDGVLGLETMFFADEVRTPGDVMLPLHLEDVSEKELQLAELMIDSLRADWDPTRYEDTTRERLMELIERRAEEGGVIERPSEEDLPGMKVPDLMEALRKSVEALRESKATPKKTKGTGSAG
jgi:DNA end-binding protein Ku